MSQLTDAEARTVEEAVRRTIEQALRSSPKVQLAVRATQGPYQTADVKPGMVRTQDMRPRRTRKK